VSLILKPVKKIRIREWVNEPTPFGLVEVEEVIDRDLAENELDLEQQVSYKFAEREFQEIMKMLEQETGLRDFYFKQHTTLNQFISKALYILTTLPKLRLQINWQNKELIQGIFAEESVTKKLSHLCRALTEIKYRMLMLARNRDENTTYFRQTMKNESYEEQEQREEPQSFQRIMTDERKEDVKEFRKRLEGKKVPARASTRIEEEIDRYLTMDKYHSESSVLRTYLDYITSLPWGVSTLDSLDIEKAKEILEESHYGMDDVKQRVLEFLAIGKLKGKVHGKILCFVGPPGVGKTSIGESIAKAVNRKFFRISLGGDQDTSTLKGFRRTYVGAIPGKIIQGLRTVQADNPVILIDEVDKIGIRSHHGDPGSVLLEVLDPEQNSAFTDDYIDVPVDLSKVFFLCTCNTEYTISKPLLDRMEIIQVSGYTHAEKDHIYEKYLLPKAIEKAGLKGKEQEFEITKEAKKRLIEDYCREPGVRGVQKAVGRITEKLAFKIVNNEKDLKVTEENIEDYIGHPPFHKARIYKETPPV